VVVVAEKEGANRRTEMEKTIGVSEFVKRQVEPGAPNFGGTVVTEEAMVAIRAQCARKVNAGEDKEGYAPFCRIVTITPDELGLDYAALVCPIALVTGDNIALVQSAMESRRPGEPAFLESWLPRDSDKVQCLAAHHVDVVLYSREQLESEGEATTGSDFDIISVNAEMEVSAPMTPSTIERNQRGPDAGGSGHVASDEEKARSVAFWGTEPGKHLFTRC
jgi:hypothetical protein